MSTPPAEDLVCGRRWRDRRAEERSVRTLPPGAQRSEHPAEGRTLREVRSEGFSRTICSSGALVAWPTPVTGTRLLRHILGSARLLTGGRDANTPDSTAVLRLSGENRGYNAKEKERSAKQGRNGVYVEKDMVYPPRYPSTVYFQYSYEFVDMADLTSMGVNNE